MDVLTAFGIFSMYYCMATKESENPNELLRSNKLNKLGVMHSEVR